MTVSSIKINHRLELEIYSVSGRHGVKVRLSRIEAQAVAGALLEYSGASGHKSIRGQDSRTFCADDLTPVPAEFKPKPNVRVGSTVGVVRLGRRT